MEKQFDNNLKISLWNKMSKAGNEYLSGSTDIDGQRYWLTGFLTDDGMIKTLKVKNADTEDQTSVDITSRESASGIVYFKIDGSPILIGDTKYWISIFVSESENPNAPSFTGKIEEVEETSK